MNAPIGRLFAVIVIMFALLIVWTSRWTVFDATALNTNPLNQRTLADEVKIKLGHIYADNHEVLAKSVPAGGGTWRREYPTGSLFAQVIGYHNAEAGQEAGLEESRLSALEGTSQGLGSVFGQTSGTQVGNDVYTSLDPAAQKVARADLAGRAGSVVALDPRTGAVLVMYSNPTYDDNDPNAKGGSQFDNATQAQRPPGSTFKIVTATAGIDSGRYTPNSMINGRSPITVSGVPLSNDDNEQYGLITLTDALTNSVNTVFAQVAENVGIPTMTRYMRRFGFYSAPPIDLPRARDQVASSKPYDSNTGRPLRPGSGDEDIGRIGIGQGGLLVTPLQMAMVVSAVADGGILMRPHVTSRIVDPDGQTVTTIAPTVLRRVMKTSTANDLKQMMLKVVEEGTGQPAQLGGISVAGKTGTAQLGPAGLTEPWFVGLAPVNAPRVVVAATVLQTDDGYGATIAAPIARDVLKTLLAEGK